ncbi:hypothetical protein [Serratia fonticola]|uniref:hypothetical protein n=1 Tax=Serratia fonticola TaxID=47917 RepID=UPI0013766F96|nr:hypothetical protein [Serratia fonticola]NCG55204.1 hypothetical protein [Serratia fonticola]
MYSANGQNNHEDDMADKSREVPIQEAFDHLLKRVKQLEIETVKQKMLNEIFEAVIGCLILINPEPEKFDALWREMGSEIGSGLASRYTSAFGESPEFKEAIHSVLNSNLTGWKALINEVIEIRKPGTEESAPSE